MRENSYLNYILTGVSLLLFAGWWFVWSLHILSLIYGKWRLHRPIHNKYGLPRARQNNGLCCRNSNPTNNLYDKAEPNTISCYDFSKLYSHIDQSPINSTVCMKNMLTDSKYGAAIPPDNSENRTGEPQHHSGCWTNLDLLSSPSLDTLTNATSYQCTHTTSSNNNNIDFTENNLGSFTNPNFKLSLDEANAFASGLHCDTLHPTISVANFHGKQQHEKGLIIPNDDKSCVKTSSLLTNSTHSRSLSLGANKHYHASIPNSSDHYLKIPPITMSEINKDISKNANNHIVSCVNNHETTAANYITGSFNQQHYRSLSGGYAPSALCLLKGNTNGSVTGPNHLTTHQQLHETTRLIKFSNNNSVTNHAKRYAATTTQIQVSGLNPAVSMSQNLLLNINTHSPLSNTSSNDNAISNSIISISSSSSVSTLQNNVNEVAVSIPITESGNDSSVNNKHLSTTNICPGVSIIKPLLGIDTHLEYNLETFFHLDYAKYEICFCIQDPKDPCVELVRTLMEKHPHIDATLFTGGPEVVVNAKINNMLPAYNAAKYEYILISDAGIMMLPDALTDMVNSMTPKIGLVHQMPFTADYRKGFSAILEKMYFGTAHARIYLVSDFLHINCCTGMSSMFRKSLIDRLPGGIAMFGKYLAEDYFMARAVRQAGYSHRISTRPALQNPGIAIDAPLTSTYDTVKLTFDTLPITTCSSQTVTDIKPLNDIVDVFDIKVHNQNGTSNPKNGKNENIIDTDLNLYEQKLQHVMYEQETNHGGSTISSTHKANNDKNCNIYVDPNPSTISSLPCKNILNNVATSSSTSNKVANKPISTPLPALPMRHKFFLRKNGIIRKCARRLIRNLKLVPVCFPNIMSGGFCWKGVRSFQERLIRWSKLRFAMEPVTIFFEPLSECLLLGLLNSWAVFYLFDWNSVLFFIIHCVVWLILDYTLLRIVQHDKLPFTRAEFVCAWLYREISALPLFFIALSTSVLKWKNNTYKLRWGGYVTKVHSHQLLFPPSSPIKKANRKLDFSTFSMSSFRDKNVSYLVNDNNKSVPQTILSSSTTRVPIRSKFKRFFGFIIVTPLGKLYTNVRKISPFKMNSLRKFATFTHLIRCNSKSSLNITSTEKINKSSINYGISNNIINSGSSPTHTLSLRDKAIMDTFSETFVQIDVSFDEKN